MAATVSSSTVRNTMIGLGAGSLAALAAAFMLPVPSTVQSPAPQQVAEKPLAPPAPAAQPEAAPDAAYAIKSALTIDAPLRHGDWHWRADAAPVDGAMLITVDLAAQTLSVFRGGHEIGVAVINYGAPEKPTPLGSFTITEKDADHKSSIYDDAPMPHMLRLTNDGISIHGAEVDGSWATNGCVGIPGEFAKLLFDAVKLGDRVVITRGATLKIGDALTLA